jgi:hypothetical protein
MSDQFFIFFQESVLNGRIEPVGVVEGFKAEIGAGGRFCPKHITLPVTAYFVIKEVEEVGRDRKCDMFWTVTY